MATANTASSSKPAGSKPVDEELERVTKEIKECKKVDDPVKMEKCLQDSLSYLMVLPSTTHFFCKSHIRIVATHVLQIFAFDNTPELEWLKTTLAKQLQECYLCVKAYHKEKIPLKLEMLDQGIDESDVEAFVNVLEAWDIERVTATLQPSAAKCEAALKADPKKAIEPAVMSASFNSVYECLYAPHFLLASKELASVFRVLFLGIQNGGRFLRLPNNIVPAMITFRFMHDEPEYVRWAEKSLNILTNKVTAQDFDSCVHRAYQDCVHSYIERRNSSSEDIVRFWKGMYRLLTALTKPVILRHCCGSGAGNGGASDDSIVKLAWRDVQASPNSLPTLLHAFSVLLTKLESDMWPVSSPFIATSFTDIIFSDSCSAIFENALREVASQAQKINVLLEWIWPFIRSVSGSNKLKVCELLTARLLGKYQDPMKFGVANDYLRSRLLLAGFNVLKLLLDFGKADKNDLFRSSYSVDKIMRRESRNCAETYATLFVDHASRPASEGDDPEVKKAAMDVVVACIAVDCISITEESEHMIAEVLASAAIKQKDVTQPVLDEADNDAVAAQSQESTTFCFGDKFWGLLQRRLPEDDTDFALTIIQSLGKTKIYLAETIDNIRINNEAAGGSNASNATSQLIALKIQKFKKLSSLIDKSLFAVSKILQHISDFSAIKLQKQLLADRECVEVLLSCSLSPHSALSRTSLEIVKQAYDAEGRMESLRGLFSSNPAFVLSGYVSTLKNTVLTAVLTGAGPVPKLVRMTMDIKDLIFDPRDGYIATHNSAIADKEVRAATRSFWDATWRSLAFIYKRTLTWARAYPKDMMVDYMRDILELSSQLFDNYQLLEQALTTNVDGGVPVIDLQTISPSKPTAVGIEILNVLIDPLRQMSPWLRLQDTALLEMCVHLVCGLLKKMHTAHVEVPNDILKRLDKLSHKSEVNYNNLTDGQCYDIVMAISEFDYQLMYDRAESAESDVKSEPTEQVKSEPSTATKPHAKSKEKGLDSWLERGSTLQSKSAAPKDPRQHALEAAFKQAQDEEAKAEAILKASRLNTVRQNLHEQRQRMAAAKAENEVIHPPRPPGFRVTETAGAAPLSRVAGAKHAAPLASLSDDSSDEESDDDIDSLFTLAKHNRPAVKGNTSSAIAPMPLRVHSSVSGVRRPFTPPAMSEKERSERNMRARLRVNMSALYHRILRWDYHSESDLPSDEFGGDLSKYKPIPNKFNSAMEYKAVFEPLLMLEAVQSIVKSKIEKYDKPFRLTVNNRASCDDYIEIYASLDSKLLPVLKIGDMDVIVITFIQEEQNLNMGQGLKGRPAQWPSPKYLNCMAKIKEIKRSHNELSDMVLRCLPSPELARNLLPKTELNGLRVMSMTTIEREYSSLQGLPYYDLCDQILQARPANMVRAEGAKIKRAQQIYKVNAPQAGAIIGAMEATGFTLIQGPPGTGKTKTILGIIGATLSTTKSRGIPIGIPGQRAQAPKEPATLEQKRILVCAPSNAAVDELVLRLKGGIRNSSGEFFIPKMVRLGRSDAANPAVRDLTLEELVDAEVAKFEDENNKKKGISIDKSKTLREELNAVLAERSEIDAQLNTTEDAAERAKLRERRDVLHAKKAALGQKLDEERDRHSVAVRASEIERRSIQARLVTDAEILCATLSGAGHELMASLALTFDTVIIDEAAQCVELSALIPLKYGATRCAMVGDPNQLPPTVLSQTASKYLYEQSLFVRMQKNYPSSVHLLSIQYRMHPQISKFPSAQFYQSRLIDGDGMADHTAAPWHSGAEQFGPYRFFDVHSREQVSKTHSYSNRAEAECAITLYKQVCDTFPDVNFEGRVGIVTPYKEQLRTLRETFMRALGQTGIQGIDFNTIDGFQGQEKDIIILSCVRAQPAGSGRGVGFISDIRRMNVALTRAKSSLWIIGNVSSLVVSDVWRNLIDDAKKRGLVSFFDGHRVVSGNYEYAGPTAGSSSSSSAAKSGSKPKVPQKRPKANGEANASKHRKLNDEKK
ncbi:SEN1 N terminal-domain-containing protein [Myxozyma melibiosi]|uniref:SEN1 N terminal-domain-containing protein n=1 Tax=Myxozyma melibiosi TaxID=54550 RepID=A0ABR1FEZ0_9ASCO